MRLLRQPPVFLALLVLLLLLYTPGGQLLVSSALANRLGGPGDFFIVAQLTGEAFAVGRNTHGQLGLGLSNTSVNFPQQVRDASNILTDVVGVCACNTHACVRRRAGNSNNQVACSGNGWRIGYANSPAINVFTNKAVPTSRVSNLLCGLHNTFALDNVTGQAWGWGANAFGFMGVGDNSHVYAPTLIPTFNVDNKVIQIDSGQFHACFLTAAGKVLCSGLNQYGALGVNIDDYDYNVNMPTAVVFLNADTTTFTSVSCGLHHTCASTGTGSVWCWGSNFQSQQGQQPGAGSLRMVQPTLVLGVQDARFVWAGYYNVFAVLNNGSALAWGQDKYGVFGGEHVPISQRTPLAFARGVGGIQELQGGYKTTCILTTTPDQVRCVGRNDFDQFGVGPAVPRSIELLTMGEYAPTKAPTAPRTRAPTRKKRTKYPSKYPTKYPINYPTNAPTKYPTKAPTQKPTTKYPTKYPTKAPTSKPAATG